MAQTTTADGGTDTETKSLRDLGGRHGDAVLRHYSADGHLYAYRDGDKHVVVSNGRDRGDQWTERAPAERTGVKEDEHLWTIPENWEREIGIERVNGGPDVIYRVPETDDCVRVSTPKNNHLVDAWYGVKSVGDTLAWDLRDAPDANSLDDAIVRYEDRADERGDSDDYYRDVADGLAAVAEHFEEFDAAYREAVEMSIPHLRGEMDDDHATLPVKDHRFEHVWGVGLDLDRDTPLAEWTDHPTEVAGVLVEEDVVTRYPAFAPRVK